MTEHNETEYGELMAKSMLMIRRIDSLGYVPASRIADMEDAVMSHDGGSVSPVLGLFGKHELEMLWNDLSDDVRRFVALEWDRRNYRLSREENDGG